jgi:hypothetical protein
LLAEREGGTRMYYFTPEHELDFVITIRGKPRLVGKVKLGKMDDRDLRRFEEGAAVFPDAKKVLVCSEEREWSGVTVLTPARLCTGEFPLG